MLGLRLDGGAEKEGKDELDNTQNSVGHEHDSVGIDGCPSVDLLEPLYHPPADDCANGCTRCADEGVPREYVTADVLVGELSECGFLDGSERTDLVSTEEGKLVRLLVLQIQLRTRYGLTLD